MRELPQRVGDADAHPLRLDDVLRQTLELRCPVPRAQVANCVFGWPAKRDLMQGSPNLFCKWALALLGDLGERRVEGQAALETGHHQIQGIR